MSYHGYIPVVHSFLTNFESPRILEIGLCEGIATFPLLQRCSRTHRSFKFTGVDILLRPSFSATLRYMLFEKDQEVNVLEENSLAFLERANEQFDLILLDGDHNYYTVSRELAHLDRITHSGSVVICDDYNGRWGTRDLFYAESAGYQDNPHATQREATEKEGVKPAVDEFLASHPDWVKGQMMPGEPVVLVRRSNPYIRVTDA